MKEQIIERILKNLILCFASPDKDGNYWGYDTNLGDGVEEINVAVSDINHLVSQARLNEKERIKNLVRNIGDTSDYPEWEGAAGINVGLIPKEKVLKL